MGQPLSWRALLLVYRIRSFIALGGPLILALFLYTRYRARITGGPS